MGEFILDYEELRTSKDPDGDPLLFFESTCNAGMQCAGLGTKFIGSGKRD